MENDKNDKCPISGSGGYLNQNLLANIRGSDYKKKWYESNTISESYIMVLTGNGKKMFFEFFPDSSGTKILDVKYTIYLLQEKTFHEGTFKNPKGLKTISYFELAYKGSCYKTTNNKSE